MKSTLHIVPDEHAKDSINKLNEKKECGEYRVYRLHYEVTDYLSQAYTCDKSMDFE